MRSSRLNLVALVVTCLVAFPVHAGPASEAAEAALRAATRDAAETAARRAAAAHQQRIAQRQLEAARRAPTPTPAPAARAARPHGQAPADGAALGRVGVAASPADTSRLRAGYEAAQSRLQPAAARNGAAGTPRAQAAASRTPSAPGAQPMNRQRRVASALDSVPPPSSAPGHVLVDSSAVPYLRRDTTLGGRILPGEQPVVSHVTLPELRNAVASPQGNLRAVPRVLAELPVVKPSTSIDTRINIRGRLPAGGGRFGDGVIGAQALDGGMPLVTNDKRLRTVVTSMGGSVR